MTDRKTRYPINYREWAQSCIGFIREKGLEREFTDWCGGWRCPIPPRGLVNASALETEYIVLCGQIVGNQGHGFECVYDFDGRRFNDRKAAIRHGLRVRGSDDFNIGVLQGGYLTSLDWMDEVVDSEPDKLTAIAEQIGLHRLTPTDADE